jgi:hypothetical protein
MSPGGSCGVELLTIRGEDFVRVGYGNPKEGWKVGEDPPPACHDCNVRVGAAHHLGCDAERCPRCGGQLIGCGCLG